MEEKAGPSFGQRIIAALVLALAAYILLKVIIGIAAAVAGTIVVIVAIVAVIWALRVLLQKRVLYLIIAFFFGLAGGVVGRLKGSSFLLWFLISAIVPLVGLIAAVLYRYEIDEPERLCPNCGKVCKVYEALCTRCGCELDYPEAPLDQAVHSAS